MDINNSALLLASFTMILFLINAIKNKHYSSITDFLFSSQSIMSNKFSSTTVASGTSLSTVFIFFIVTVPIFGWWLFFAPFTYIIGLWIAKIIFEKISITTNINEIGSISDFIFNKTESNSLVFVTEFITFLGFLAIILVEIILGLQILDYFMAEDTINKLLFLIFILLIISLYVYFGGYKAVIESDIWQNKLIMASVISFFVYLLLIAGSNIDKTTSGFQSFNHEASTFELLIFLLNVLILNIFLPISQLSMWHRVNITKSINDMKVGIKKSMKIIFTLWGILIFIGLFLAFLNVKITDAKDIFLMLVATSSLGAYIIFPLVFIGMISALLSTIDTSLITMIYLLFKSKKVNINFKNKISIFSSILFIMTLVIILYIIVSNTVGIDLVSIIFTILGQIVLLGPPIILLATSSNKISTNNSKILMLGLIFSIILLWAISFYGMSISILWVSQLAIPIAVLTSALFSFIVWKKR